MTDSPSISNPLPPQLSMDDYADFVEASLRDCDPARVARQKELEERILTPFRMGAEEKAEGRGQRSVAAAGPGISE